MKTWQQKFYTIWAGQAFSILSSAVLQMALIWHLTALTKSAAVLSIASIAGFLPTAILGYFAGAWVDRLNRKLVMISADIFIALVSLVLAVVALFGDLPIWLILVVLAVRSVGVAFHSPAISAVTPLLVPEEMLPKCAGMTQSLETVGYILGAAIAGILYPIWSISAMVILDVVGAMIGCLTVAMVKIPMPPKTDKSQQTHLLTEMKLGYTEFKRHRGLFALLWIGSAFTFLYAPINALFPLLTMEHFGGTTADAAITEIAFSIGMLLGGVLISVWGGFKNRAISIVLSLVLMGGTILFTGLLPANGFWIFAVLCVFMGLSVPFYSGAQMSLIQEQIAPEYLGRVFGLYGSMMSLSMPLGLILSGVFADKIGVPTWFILTGIGNTVLVLITLLIPSVRNIEQEKA